MHFRHICAAQWVSRGQHQTHAFFDFDVCLTEHGIPNGQEAFLNPSKVRIATSSVAFPVVFSLHIFLCHSLRPTPFDTHFSTFCSFSEEHGLLGQWDWEQEFCG